MFRAHRGYYMAPLELLPKSILILSQKERISLEENNGSKEIPGNECAAYVADWITRTKWKPEIVAQLVTILREVNLSSESMENVVKKTFRLINFLSLVLFTPVFNPFIF